MCFRANTTLGFLRRNLFSCPQDVKEVAYKTLVRPILEYGSTVWDPHCNGLNDELENVQKRAVRFVTRNYSYETGSMTGILEELKWETLQKRRKDNRLILMYKGLKGKARNPTDDLIPKNRRCRPVTTYLKVFRRKSERMPKARVGGGHEGLSPSRKGGVGGSPPRFVLIDGCLCAFLMRFGQNFSRLRLIWNRRHLYISIMEHCHRTIDTVSGLKIVMHANSKRFIHTLPTDRIILGPNIQFLVRVNYTEGIITSVALRKKKHATVVFHSLLAYKIKTKAFFNTILDQRL